MPVFCSVSICRLCPCFSLLKHCIFKLSIILTLFVLPNFMCSPSSCYNQLKYVCQLLSHLPPDFCSVWLFAFSKHSWSAAYKRCSVQSTSLPLSTPPSPSHGGFYGKLRHQSHGCGCSSGNQKHESQAVRQTYVTQQVSLSICASEVEANSEPFVQHSVNTLDSWYCA